MKYTKKRAFTLIELMVVMMIIGIMLMTITPKMMKRSVGEDPVLTFFDTIMKEELKRALELGTPIVLTGFKGSNNLLNHDKETKKIPDIDEVSEAKINNYETLGNEYAIRVYPDGLCDHFELTLDDGRIIESIPLLMTTRYKENSK